MASESEPKFHGQVEEDFSKDEEFLLDWEVIEYDEFDKTDGAAPNDDGLKTEMETADSAAANMQNPESETENGQEMETADSADSNVHNPESETEVNESGSAMVIAEQARIHTQYHFNFSFLDFVVTVFMILEDTNSSSRFHIHIEGNYHSNDPAPDDEVEEDEDEEEEEDFDLVEKCSVACAYLLECIGVLYLMWMGYSLLMPNTSPDNKRLNMI